MSMVNEITDPVAGIVHQTMSSELGNGIPRLEKCPLATEHAASAPHRRTVTPTVKCNIIIPLEKT